MLDTKEHVLMKHHCPPKEIWYSETWHWYLQPSEALLHNIMTSIQTQDIGEIHTIST